MVVSAETEVRKKARRPPLQAAQGMSETESEEQLRTRRSLAWILCEIFLPRFTQSLSSGSLNNSLYIRIQTYFLLLARS